MTTTRTPGPWTYHTSGPLRGRITAPTDPRFRHPDDFRSMDDIAEVRQADNGAYIVRAVNAHEALVEALAEIAKGEGAFSRDPLTHAGNTIDNMKRLATAALALAREGDS